MKSLLLLWQKVADESATWCCTSATMDVKTVHFRFEHEGLSFLTITLPQFGKDFEKSLDQGEVDRRLFNGFRWKGGLPLFLGGFLDRVFDRDSGVLLDNPDIDAIRAIRQLTLMNGKIALPCTEVRKKRAMLGYIKCELDVRVADELLSDKHKSDFQRISAMLFGKMFTEIDRKILFLEHMPRHGPGSTAERITGNRKYEQHTWPTRLDKYFPSREMLIPNDKFISSLEEVDVLEPVDEIPVRIISVPKTLKTPRIIGIEPLAMQYAQQAILPLINDGIRRSHSLRTMIGTDSQEPNQLLALQGSLTGKLATLDLSEASDRVSNQHVRMLLSQWPFLHGAVDASRSRKADVPGFGKVRLAKFASMGSALCFPMEAMVFLTIIFMGIEQELNTSLSAKEVKLLMRGVRVYGDDIIVPVDYVRSVVSMLQDFGLVVNTSKSFWNGKFRESCGREYYHGEDVSIVRVRNVFPTQLKHATGVISIVSLRNQLYFAGYWQTCKWLDEYIRKLIKHFPVVLPSSPVQGRHSFLGYETQKLDEHLHSPFVKGYVVKAKIPNDKLDNQGALLKYLIKRGTMPSADVRHLERAGRPQSVDIKLRWSPAT